MEIAFKYENSDWPNFIYSSAELIPILTKIYRICGRIEGRFELASLEFRDDQIIKIVAQEICDNASIEGTILDFKDVEYALRKSLGVSDTDKYFKSEGYTKVFADTILDKTALTKERINQWYEWYFLNESSDSLDIPINHYAKERIEIRNAFGNLIYKTPPIERLQLEMNMLLLWLQTSQENTFIKAGITHLWFEIIHPFSEGNGIIGRNIIDYILSQELESSFKMIGFSNYIKQDIKEYNRQLAYHFKGDLEITEYLKSFLESVLNSVKELEVKLSQLLFKTQFWNTYQGVIFNQRQLKVIDEILDGNLEEVLTVNKWSRMTGVGYDTANADIKGLLEVGILIKSSEGQRNKKFTLNKV